MSRYYRVPYRNDCIIFKQYTDPSEPTKITYRYREGFWIASYKWEERYTNQHWHDNSPSYIGRNHVYWYKYDDGYDPECVKYNPQCVKL